MTEQTTTLRNDRTNNDVKKQRDQLRRQEMTRQTTTSKNDIANNNVKKRLVEKRQDKRQRREISKTNQLKVFNTLTSQDRLPETTTHDLIQLNPQLLLLLLLWSSLVKSTAPFTAVKMNRLQTKFIVCRLSEPFLLLPQHLLVVVVFLVSSMARTWCLLACPGSFSSSGICGGIGIYILRWAGKWGWDLL